MSVSCSLSLLQRCHSLKKDPNPSRCMLVSANAAAASGALPTKAQISAKAMRTKAVSTATAHWRGAGNAPGSTSMPGSA
eukprot:CAMPEP_0180746762 /NCGR_PEP_ID=MMETSP1038_2-20121128/29191_1 /TAXON_ID=632150 /ORGANISM="Azadinium spinosum, Strain 3D9" /LENGTH=78 /DNA_ID=CAMNT_0022780341 /DNA_START=228 /DNA_END=461 /DNA_ORIENTATION=+